MKFDIFPAFSHTWKLEYQFHNSELDGMLTRTRRITVKLRHEACKQFTRLPILRRTLGHCNPLWGRIVFRTMIKSSRTLECVLTSVSRTRKVKQPPIPPHFPSQQLEPALQCAYPRIFIDQIKHVTTSQNQAVE